MGTERVTNENLITVDGLRVQARRIEGNLGETHRKLTEKLVPRDELESLGDFLRNRGLKISFTTGVFDLPHIGHARYLELAKSLGDVLIVGLNTDSSVRELKGPQRPILKETERAEMISFLGAVDYITLFPETHGGEVVRKLKPDIYLCVEGGWESDLQDKEEVIAMSDHGGTVYYCPRQEPRMSTTAIIELIGSQVRGDLLEQVRQLIQPRE